MKSENAKPLRGRHADNVQPILREDRTSVQALSRALSLLEILGEDDDGYRLIDLAERSGLPSPTVHRLLTTMQQKRFVSFEPDKNLWHIGAQCFSVGSVFGRRHNIIELATPIMRRLRDVAGETVNLGGMDQDDVLLLHQIESKQMVRAISRPGSRSPLANTAMGKSILAWQAAERVTEVIQHGGLQRLTPQSIARGTTLHGALAGIRARGYAIDNEETAMGLRCVAAAVFNEFGVAVAAVSVVGPTSRVTSDRVESLGRHVMAATRDITLLVGGRLPKEMPAMAVPEAS